MKWRILLILIFTLATLALNWKNLISRGLISENWQANIVPGGIVFYNDDPSDFIIKITAADDYIYTRNFRQHISKKNNFVKPQFNMLPNNIQTIVTADLGGEVSYAAEKITFNSIKLKRFFNIHIPIKSVGESIVYCQGCYVVKRFETQSIDILDSSGNLKAKINILPGQTVKIDEKWNMVEFITDTNYKNQFELQQEIILY